LHRRFENPRKLPNLLPGRVLQPLHRGARCSAQPRARAGAPPAPSARAPASPAGRINTPTLRRAPACATAALQPAPPAAGLAPATRPARVKGASLPLASVSLIPVRSARSATATTVPILITVRIRVTRRFATPYVQHTAGWLPMGAYSPVFQGVPSKRPHRTRLTSRSACRARVRAARAAGFGIAAGLMSVPGWPSTPPRPITLPRELPRRPDRSGAPVASGPFLVR
jgi:hypothetical protein